MTVTAVRAKWVLGYDTRAEDHALIEDGVVVVDGGAVAAVGTDHDADVREAIRGDHETIDLGRSLVMPGLIDLDAVCDIDHALIDSWQPADLRAKLAWSADWAQKHRRHTFSADERRLIRRYALTQLALHGVTTCMPIAAETHSDWAESYEDAVAMAEEAEAVGIRMYGGPSFRSGVNVIDRDGLGRVHWEPQLGRAGLDDAIRFVEWAQKQPSDLIHGVLLPCRIETLTEELLLDTVAAARDLGTPFRLHALQGMAERERTAEASGETPLRLLQRTKTLGPDMLLPHGIYLDDDPTVAAADRAAGATPVEGDPLAVLADAGVTVVHCPLTSARYASALRSFDRYRAAGVRIALGTDSFPPDLIRGMDVGMLVAKVIEGRPDAATAEDYLRAGTLVPAESLDRSDLGRIVAGGAADLIAFRLDGPRAGVVDDPVRTLLMNGNARDLVMSMINGRVVVRDGVLQGVDVESLTAAAQDLFQRMADGYLQRSAWPVDRDSLFPPTFRRLGKDVATDA
ncbi:MAG TPA: chlorohydrolase family protein [Microlunatus sp.]